MRDVATQPDDLERLFVDRANAGDVDGLVALYEPNAILVAEDGLQAGGTDQIRAFFVALAGANDCAAGPGTTCATVRGSRRACSIRHWLLSTWH